MLKLLPSFIFGGTTALDIENSLKEAEILAIRNYQNFSHKENNVMPITAVLFFDEANTTEAIGKCFKGRFFVLTVKSSFNLHFIFKGLIKEIMCDLSCNGRSVNVAHSLKIVAAINPYKKHSDKTIEKLEQADLGFFLTADETKEKFGLIPMRQLVYRVQPLPSSLLPIVWDFVSVFNTSF